MPGLFFIALNRILAPAFYAQSDTKSPTMAGIISFGVNILLSATLVGPFRGAGIALALSVSSAVNTVLLLIFLKKNPNIAMGSALGLTIVYIFKLILLSVLAVIPIYFLSPVLLEVFAGRGRIVSYGIPLAVNAVVFITLGFGMLAVIKDRQFLALVQIFRKK